MSNELTQRVNTRQSNMELLRVIAMLGVILLHYNVVGMGNAFELASVRANSLLLQGLEAVFAWPVNAFMMLSGYFMCTKKRVDIKKPVALLVELIIFQLALELFSAGIQQSALSAKGMLMKLVPANYYVVLYVAVYIFSPYINSFLDSINTAQCRKLLLLLLAVFSVWPYGMELLERITAYPLNQASTISSMGTQNGYNITNFALCYAVGAGLRKKAIDIKKPFIAFVAATFTVYLAHTVLYSFCMIERFANANVLLMLAHIVLCQIIIYSVCFIVFLIYDTITKPLFKMLWGRVNAPEINLE